MVLFARTFSQRFVSIYCEAAEVHVLTNGLRQDSQRPPESEESKSRRLFFDRLRYALSDLMMTADEKNHVISNANEELDRQLLRLDTVFPYIGNEISDESRLGSLTHWAYTNRNTVKAAANERPRREAASHRHDLAHLHEVEIGSREAKREAAAARRHRRANIDSDFDDPRPHARRTHAKGRGGTANEADHGTTVPKRRRVERAPVETGTVMELSASGSGHPAGRNTSKDAGPDAVKKRSRAPNTNSASRKRYVKLRGLLAVKLTPNRNTTAHSAADSPILAPSPVAGTFNPPRNGASPGPSSMARVQSSRTQNSTQVSNGRQRPPSSASNRTNNNSGSRLALLEIFLTWYQINQPSQNLCRKRDLSMLKRSFPTRICKATALVIIPKT